MIIVNAVKCPKCADIIYSRARHDCRHCSCGNVFIDGGFDYVRVGGDISVKVFKLDIVPTKQELYTDWNTNKHQYGLIKTRLKTVDEWEKEWFRKKSLRRKIIYKFWNIYYYFQIGIGFFLYKLAEKITRLARKINGK